MVVNRGNSQIVLLAMIQKIPLIVIPEGITTLFHGHLDPIIANSVTEFRRVVNVYQTGRKFDYAKILESHLPLSREQSLDRVDKFFRRALEQRTPPGNGKAWDMSILFAFLGDRTQAQVIVKKLPQQDRAFLLKKLYDGNISAEEFASLLEYFPNKINRWHLQALFIRKLMNNPNKNDLANSVECLEGFDGDVNPHYFMEDIIGRIELEFKAGRNTVAQRLFHKFSDEYSIFSHHRQAFDMMRFVYKDFSRHRGLRKKLWILSNLPKSYCRQYIKGKFLSAANRAR
jgi:hypothetical protein